MAHLIIDNISKCFQLNDESINGNLNVINSFSANIPNGNIVCLFGPNGCGKTTLLNIIAGLINQTSGTISINESVQQSNRVGYVFQDYRNSLLPWMTLRDNIALPLTFLNIKKNERYDKVENFLGIIDINLPLNMYPYQLSGGQQQLACIIRAMIHDPAFLVMDEPFSSLDYSSRYEIHTVIQKIWQKLHPTVLMVSHDIDEAIILGDTVIVLSPRPMNVLDKINICFSKPRSKEILETLEFSDLRRHILKLIREAHET